MRKPDEVLFFNLLRDHGQQAGKTGGLSPRDIINRPGFRIPLKRAHYYLSKWSARDWYDYGVSLDLGWLTSEAPDRL